jgi:hypothetical protein
MVRARRSKEPPLVPRKYSGLWIAWDRKQERILGSGRTFAEAKQAALEAGEPNPLLAKVPKADIRFVGRWP